MLRRSNKRNGKCNKRTQIVNGFVARNERKNAGTKQNGRYVVSNKTQPKEGKRFVNVCVGEETTNELNDWEKIKYRTY